ncbi:MAG: hypothetical protein ACRDJU_05245, partial [Actinomycetota bacterium]
PAPMPPSIVHFAQSTANCLAVYSAWIQARWQKQLALPADQLSEELPQVRQCLRSAGIHLPANADGALLAGVMDSPGWTQGLTTQQAGRCLPAALQPVLQ